MQTIEFESRLSQGVIPIPKTLRMPDGGRVRVLLQIEESESPNNTSAGVATSTPPQGATEILEQAFTEAAKLSASEQNELGCRIMAELESEKRWDELFENSQDLLSRLAGEALAEHREGKTQPMDIDKL